MDANLWDSTAAAVIGIDWMNWCTVRICLAATVL